MTLNNEKNWTIIQISDTHLMDQDHLEFVRMNPEQSFHHVMQHIVERHPQLNAIVHTGDLAQVPVPRTYQRYLDFMQSLKTPFYQVPGNHDNAEHFPFHQQQNKVHVIHFGPWSVVLLNSAVKGKIDGWVDETQLNQLEQILQEFAQQHIVIACHHHPFEMQSKWIDQHKLKNTQDLTAVLAKYHNVKIVLSGHVHQESWREWHSIQFYSTPSTSVQFKPLSDHFALDEQAPGYRILQLNADGSHETHVERVLHAQQKINVEISGY